jgi:hypothetical protein
MRAANEMLEAWRDGSSYSARQAARLSGGSWALPEWPVVFDYVNLLESPFEESGGLLWTDADGKTFYVAPGDAPAALRVHRRGDGWECLEEIPWQKFIRTYRPRRDDKV